MTIDRQDSNQRMSQIVEHGNIVYLAGQVASGASVAEQTNAILTNIEALLKKAGSDKSQILTTTIWLTSMDSFAEMNAEWDSWVNGSNAPARACVESPRLATPEFLVEMMVVAAK